MSQGQITSVDEIAHDDQKLKEKATELVGFQGLQSGNEVVLDKETTVGTDFGTVDSSVCAILVKKHGAVGAVRVFSNPVTNVVTGPTQGTGFVIVVRKSGEDCRLFGNPSLRYFRRRSS